MTPKRAERVLTEERQDLHIAELKPATVAQAGR